MSVLKPPVGDNDHVEGDDSASIELVEFGDYQCPHCGAAYPIIKKIQKEFGSQIKFVYRNFPLTEIHPLAMSAAIAAEAAGLQDKFWEMHDTIFEHQKYLSVSAIYKFAQESGVDLEKFKTDIQKQELQELVESHFESGVRSGVNGTPSFFVNGKKFDGGAEDLYEVLKESTAI